MTYRFFGLTIMLVAVTAYVSLGSVRVSGQAVTAEAKAWTPPRTPDGQPDIQGFWTGGAGIAAIVPEKGVYPPEVSIGPPGVRCYELSLEAGRGGAGTGPCQPYPRYFQEVGRQAARPQTQTRTRARGIVDPPDGKLPWRPEGLAKRDEHFKYLQDPPTLAHVDPGVRCVPAGVPRAGVNQILQSPGQVVLIAEANHQYRVIPLDGRPHVGPNVRTWMGDSVGRWEGQTLIIDTTNFIGGTWYDMVGTYQSDDVHVIERFTIVDVDTIDYDVTIDDPKVFTKPWTIAGGFTRAEEYELYEAACVEGSKALDNILFDRLAK